MIPLYYYLYDQDRSTLLELRILTDLEPDVLGTSRFSFLKGKYIQFQVDICHAHCQ
jgi:hypothetical protein